MALVLLDAVNRFLTVVLAVGVVALAAGTLVVARQLATDASFRSTLRRAASVTLQDPNMIFERHAERNPKTKELLVSFGRYRASARLLFQGVLAGFVVLVFKLLVMLFSLIAEPVF